MRSSNGTLRTIVRSLGAFAGLVLAVSSSACAADTGPSDSESVAGESVATNASELSLVPPIGSGSVFAQLPAEPGYPEGIVVVGTRVFVTTPARFGTAGTGPSQIYVYDLLTGAAKPPITLAGEDLSQEHALSCITSDAFGRLYALSTQLGVVRLTPRGNAFTQSIYAPPLPDLPTCTPDATGPCAPAGFEGPPIVNDLAFDWAGNLYVTDSFQATIFRVPPGGGAPAIWFQSPELAGIPFNIGLNGIRVSPDQKRVYVTVSLSAQNPYAGYVYSIPRVASPSPSDLKVVHEYAPGEGPDGIAFGLTGKLYVALAGTNAISVLSPNGTETRRLTGPQGSPIPLDGPANIAFDWQGSLLVTNHASLSNDASHFAVLETFVADLPFPLATPIVP